MMSGKTMRPSDQQPGLAPVDDDPADVERDGSRDQADAEDDEERDRLPALPDTEQDQSIRNAEFERADMRQDAAAGHGCRRCAPSDCDFGMRNQHCG